MIDREGGNPSVVFLAPLIALAALSAPQATLVPGTPAPKLEIKKWVKGKGPSAFGKDETYVVEFWATWCGPCLESIPHLTELAKKYERVRFLGISIWEDDVQDNIQEFVTKMGEKMDYTVGYSGNKTGMAVTWMDAAKQSGIPTAFIVKNNTIMWIGHPMQLDKPLAEIASDRYDLKLAKEKFENGIARREAARKLELEVTEIEKQFDAGDRDGAKKRLEKVEATPEGKSASADLRFKWLASEDFAAWKAACLKRMEGGPGDRAQLSIFCSTNVLPLTAPCKWLINELMSDRFPPDWYPYLCGARMARQLKEYDKGLEYCAKSRQIILDYQAANPNAPRGNALEVIQALVDEIKKEKGG